MNPLELLDVTLACEDENEFEAHKVVLSSFSSVFLSTVFNLVARKETMMKG